ncbi:MULTISPECIES: response regulator transcription factor [Gracilibacillus]|uniref:response regulator transcription factor n=1 Tax=Gracilibacillus TaxID=74385 RepID=UPI0008271A12|nr:MULTISPECIES: response regulator [Gracilibacillus]
MYKLLVVEDEDIIREGIRYILDWTNLQCVVVGEATNGEEGLQKIVELNPDIILLDVNMPLKNGIDLLAECDDSHIFSTIILSGYDDFNYAQKAIQYGVREYLLKPVDHRELEAAINRAKKEVDNKKQFHIMEESMKTPETKNVLNVDIWTEWKDQSQHVQQMVTYIQEYYDEKISINDLVDEVGMGTTYLNKKFKEGTSYTFNEFLNRYRIQKAIERIKTGDDKITMIATEVGFSNYRYFIDVFKKYTEFLPSDFMSYFDNTK